MSALSERILTELGGPAHAVLDGARDSRVSGLTASRLARCLYRGELPGKLRQAAPYLLRLLPGEDATERLFRFGWGKAWGIVLACPGPMRALYRHLRRFLRARTEDGRTVLFRYYDPRVLRLYLPTCTAGELDSFLGPLIAVGAESDQEGVFHLFRRGKGQLEHLRCELGTTPARLLRTWPIPAPQPPRILPRIRDRQLRPFRELADASYSSQLLKLLRKEHRAEVEGLSDAEVQRRCREALDRATRHGLTGDDVLAFVLMTFTLSRSFDSHPAFRAVFSDPRIPGAQKMSALYRRVPPSDWTAARAIS